MNTQNWQRWAGISALACVALFLIAAFNAFTIAVDYDRDPCSLAAGTDVGSKDGDNAKAKVVAVMPAAKDDGKANVAAFATPVCVTVAGLGDPTFRGKPIFLFLNGEPLAALNGSIINRDKQLVLFRLDRTAEDAEIWSHLIGAPPITGEMAGRVKLSVSVGSDIASGPVAATNLAAVNLLIFKLSTFWCGLAAFATAIGVLVLLAKYTGILRDGGPGTTYSLGRCQMAWWLYLITASFLYIWLVTGQVSGVMTSDALVLLGISGTTGLAAISIPKREVQGVAAAPPTDSNGFFTDLLSGDLSSGDGVQLHRMQMLAWTFILGVVFIWKVYVSFRMPTFDNNMLIMMGISGSLYIGFKAREA